MPIDVAVVVAAAAAAAATIGMAEVVVGPNLFQIAIDSLVGPMILHQYHSPLQPESLLT